MACGQKGQMDNREIGPKPRASNFVCSCLACPSDFWCFCINKHWHPWSGWSYMVCGWASEIRTAPCMPFRACMNAQMLLTNLEFKILYCGVVLCRRSECHGLWTWGGTSRTSHRFCQKSAINVAWWWLLLLLIVEWLTIWSRMPCLTRALACMRFVHCQICPQYPDLTWTKLLGAPKNVYGSRSPKP
jgi:hypothetical protein